MRLFAGIDRDSYRERWGDETHSLFIDDFSRYLENVAVRLKGHAQHDIGHYDGVYHFRGVTIATQFGMMLPPTVERIAYAHFILATSDGTQRLTDTARMIGRQIPTLREIEFAPFHYLHTF